jgi:hypothetical protein
MGIVDTWHEQALGYLVGIARVAGSRALVAVFVVLCEFGEITFVEFLSLVVSNMVCCCAPVGGLVGVKSTILVDKLSSYRSKY